MVEILVTEVTPGASRRPGAAISESRTCPGDFGFNSGSCRDTGTGLLAFRPFFASKEVSWCGEAGAKCDRMHSRRHTLRARSLMRRWTGVLAAVAAVMIASGAAFAQDAFPTKPVRLLVPFPPARPVALVAPPLPARPP